MSLLSEISSRIRLAIAVAKEVYFIMTAQQKLWVDMYVKLIIAKRRTLADVQPANLQPYVLEQLNFLGYDQNGDPLPIEEPLA